MKKLLIFVAILFVAISCKEERIDLYPENENAVYFGVLNTVRSNPNKYAEVTEFSFADLADKAAMIGIRVNALGEVVSYDRVIDYQILMDSTTAVEGTDFERVVESVVIPANTTNGVIHFKLIRTDKISREAVAIKIRLLENNEFSTSLKSETVDAINHKYVNLIEHKIVLYDFVTRPETWVKVEAKMGEFTADKYRLINQLCNMKAEDWKAFTPPFAELMWVRTRNHLQKMKDAGTPVMETLPDGTVREMRVSGLTD